MQAGWWCRELITHEKSASGGPDLWRCCNNEARGAAVRGVTVTQALSRLDVKPFTKDVDRLRERTDTDAEGAFDNACLATNVLDEVEDGRLTLA